jgi:hypothetical protein
MGGTITAIVGGNGDGKTLGALALHARQALAKGRPVASTFEIFYEGTRQRHPNSIKITEWRQLLELHDCLLILDEINSEFPSRSSMSLPPDLLRLLHQLRKPKVDVVWTSVNWARADVALREATKRVTVARSYLPDKWQRLPVTAPLLHPSGTKVRGPNGKHLRLDDEWPPGRLFQYRTYDATAFDEFTVHTMTKLKPVKTQWYWRPWHSDQYLYDTTETVPLLDNVSETGVCLICGGTRARRKCDCVRVPREQVPDAVTAEHATPLTLDEAGSYQEGVWIPNVTTEE